ncbi:MAG: reductive dehalogenase [Dehalobacter sp. 4CP]|uniref:reductive dehalogenase n=1 Tax=Dehalobacter sp. CP TaxID=2594474 RepID=UPI0013C8F565|nr:reductive dehalogenase [Dehalobacter sp. 4CP]
MIIEQNTMPIVISKDYRRMDQKLTVFVRGFWDKEIIPVRERFEEGHYNLKPPRGSEGYTQLEEALKTAAWSVCFAYTPNNELGRANLGFYDWCGEKSEKTTRFNNPEEASKIVKSTAKFFGTDLVGIAPYDERWVYGTWYDFSSRESVPPEFPFKVKSVIVLGIEMDQDACMTSPSLIACAAIGLGYSRMGEIGKKLATFLRMLGYNAIPCGNDTALSIPIAVQAGLGEMGRSGMLITPQYGPRVRLFKIFTDLPLKPDKPISFGVSKFCMKCRKCAQSCPAGAITFEPRPTMVGPSISNSPGILKWYTNPESCFEFWAINGDDCINCIACCPYNKWASWHHGLTQKLTKSIWG